MCRKPNDGRLMVHYDGWYRGVCLGVTVDYLSDLDQFICPRVLGQGGVSSYVFLFGSSNGSDMTPARDWRQERKHDGGSPWVERDRRPKTDSGKPARGRGRTRGSRGISKCQYVDCSIQTRKMRDCATQAHFYPIFRHGVPSLPEVYRLRKKVLS